MQVVDVFDEIARAVRDESLALPNLPDIALRIQRIANDPNCNFGSIGKELKRDASISAHLIRLANSPLYLSRVPVTNVRSAVHRVGVPGVRNFVTTVVMRNLFRSNNPALADAFRNQWHDSSEISALTSVLATFCAGYDPDDALLAGLVQDIGAVTLLGHFAAGDDDPPSGEALAQAVDQWAPKIGVMVLEHWDFDPRYLEVASARGDWTVDLAPEPRLVDLVTVARAHYYLTQGRTVPPLESLPAFAKLPLTLSPAGTVHSLDEAVEEVSVIRSMLRD